MNDFELKYKPFGECSILIEWPQIISENILKSVLYHKKSIKNYYIQDKVYINSAYNSILITYDTAINNFYNEISTLKSLFTGNKPVNKRLTKLWKIPVCYAQEFGIDLEEISKQNDVSISDIIQRHTSANYRVYFLGFLPGFLYLGGLDNKLHFSRRPKPRLKVKKGSVAIGGSQTGIYPNESPGGWNIIGNSPLSFFDSNSENPCFAQSGDKIQFVSVSIEEYRKIIVDVENNTYNIESEVIND